MPSSVSLVSALDALSTTAGELGLDPQAARQEGSILAATVAESAVGAFVDWCNAMGTGPDAQAFMAAASAGRKWRTSPTTLVTQLRASDPAKATMYAQALGTVITAATQLGQPTPQVAGTASLTIAAQHNSGQYGAQPAGLPTTPPQDFAAQAPALLNQVLGQLRASQANLLQSGLDLSDLDAHAPGAFDLTGRGNAQPANPVAPTAPVTEADPANPTPAEGAGATQGQAATQAEVAVEAKPAEPAKTVDELIAELDALTGLTTVKAEIKKQAQILRVESLRTKEGLKSPTITRHLVFTGNPGTGKTTVARLVAGIYKALGLLSKGQLVEVDRSELVAGYLGQTAIKTSDVVKSAIGGVLFIDEAYGLNGDQYGEEAINTLVKEMEDHRDDLVVIVAGYTLPMAEFISNNPGLQSRFRTTIEFADYTDDELAEIFRGMAHGADYDLGEGVEEEFRHILSLQRRDSTFGNGRFARNMLEAAIGAHAWRLREIDEPTLAQLRTLEVDDLRGADDHGVVDWGAADPVDDEDVARFDAESPGDDQVSEQEQA